MLHTNLGFSAFEKYGRTVMTSYELRRFENCNWIRIPQVTSLLRVHLAPHNDHSSPLAFAQREAIYPYDSTSTSAM